MSIRYSGALASALLLTCCGKEEGVALHVPEAASQTLEAYGQLLTVERLGPIDRNTVRIASCSDDVLYSTRVNGSLWVKLDGNVVETDTFGWTQVEAGTKGKSIACDRQYLFSLDDDGKLWRAMTFANGQLVNEYPVGVPIDVWTNGGIEAPDGIKEINSGQGNLYAFTVTSASTTLYTSAWPDRSTSFPRQGHYDSWIYRGNYLGSVAITGSGAKSLVTPGAVPSGRPENRAFGINADGTLWYNDKLLEGGTSWLGVPDIGVALEQITADASNRLYAVAEFPAGSGEKQLYRLVFSELNCTDGLDNDANGMTDAEDPVCQERLGKSWCATRNSGSFCISEIQNTNGFNDVLITCQNRQVGRILHGICINGYGDSDYLMPPSEAWTAPPMASSPYCNVMDENGNWDFTFGGSVPCPTLLEKYPGSKIVRAGIYAQNQVNDVMVNCDNAFPKQFSGVGVNPLQQASAAVPRGNNHCVVTVSPREMRFLSSPFPTYVWGKKADPKSRRYWTGHYFDHDPPCRMSDPGCACLVTPQLPDCLFDLDGFGQPHAIVTSFNNLAEEDASGPSNSYDFVMTEGTPLLAMADGRVIPNNGSRDRDLSGPQPDCARCTKRQSEVYIQYDVGADPMYRETFVVYYAHLRRRLVEPGQVVKRGQVIGYVGTTGNSSEPHVHLGVMRMTNINAVATAGTTPTDFAFGYHVSFDGNPNHESQWGMNPERGTGPVDPYGWRAPQGVDPAGWMWADAAVFGPDNNTFVESVRGLGAWSPSLWLPGQQPPYPVH